MAEPVRPAPTATPDPALDKRIAELNATLDSSRKAFATAAQDAEARIAVARGLPVGSDKWLDAQTALSILASHRAPVTNALAELEELAIDRGAAGQPPYPTLDSAISAADAMATAQEERIKSLEAALASA